MHKRSDRSRPSRPQPIDEMMRQMRKARPKSGVWTPPDVNKLNERFRQMETRPRRRSSGGVRQGPPGTMSQRYAAQVAAARTARMIMLFGLIYHLYLAWCLMVLAKKTNTPAAWLAWIPVVNYFLMLMIAEKPVWWSVLTIVPIGNLIILVVTWMAIADIRGQPSWLGVLIVVPVGKLVLPGLLAFADRLPKL